MASRVLVIDDEEDYRIVIRDILSSAGFEVDSVPTTTLSLASTLAKGAFDLALAPLATGAFPSSLASAFGVAPPGSGNSEVGDWSGYDDPKLDALFAQASAELAADQEQGLYQQIDQALWVAMPSLPIFAEPSAMVWSASLTSLRDDPGGLGPLWGVATWARLVAAPTTSRSAAGHRAGG